MQYSIQPRNRVFVKGYGYLSFAKNMGKNIGKNKSKNLCDKYSQKRLDVPHLEITEVVLIHFSIINNDYQQDSRVLYIFAPNKSFGVIIKYFTRKFYVFKNF